ncbi:MAG: hypothetical protein DMF62_11080 [Acidobacteria bacterium]|nr:MAG: hypothetical protein DMF62_11080 [Acidobacteriota bacterium]PYS99932.1 MAG: hypothetical protein DMF63_09340 [Acidobacteriota bacterium]
MNKKLIVGLSSLVLLSGFAASPIGADKNVGLSVEVGSVALDSTKLDVTIAFLVTPGAIETQVFMAAKGIFNFAEVLEVKETINVATMLEQVSEKAAQGQPEVQNVGKVTVKSENGKVVMDFKSEGFRASQVKLDSENAATLGRLLRRAKEVSAWVAPRIAGLKER